MFNSIEEAKGFLEQRGFKIDEKDDIYNIFPSVLPKNYPHGRNMHDGRLPVPLGCIHQYDKEYGICMNDVSMWANTPLFQRYFEQISNALEEYDMFSK